MLRPLIGQHKRRYTLHITEQQYRRWKRLQKKASQKGMRLVLQETLNQAFTKALNMAEKELSKLE